MSSRRARIKAVANLPTRRKNDGDKVSQKSESTENATCETGVKEISQTNLEKNISKSKNTLTDSKTVICSDTPTTISENSFNNTVVNDDSSIQTSLSTVVTENNSKISIKNHSEELQSHSNGINNVDTDTLKDNSKTKTSGHQNAQRRRITKPVLINKHNSLSTQDKCITQDKTTAIENCTINNCSTTDKLSQVSVVNKTKSFHNNLNITPLNILNNNSLPEKENNNIVGESSIIDDSLLFNPPQSPSKNRPRIRPTPRLSCRRNSIQGSASESEDEGRHQNRSNFNLLNSPQVNDSSQSSFQNSTITRVTKQKKRLRRTDQSRKLAEARKSFLYKFGSNTPDRSQLTVFDMIYYNPSANPMKKSEDGKANENSEEIVHEEENEENVDNPEPEEPETAMPVPQIKIGPSGEIILDEQSLVIETTGTKKGREDIASSNLVYDDGNTNYGIYKKRRRPKEWTVNETLRFYKTLNTVGTDFSIMVSLFPGRTRRDLKLKFKKEERINSILVNKALRNPQDFDLSILEEELKREQLKKEEKKAPPKPKPKAPKPQQENTQKKSKRRKKMSSLVKVLTSVTDDETEDLSNDAIPQINGNTADGCSGSNIANNEPLPSMRELTKTIDANRERSNQGYNLIKELSNALSIDKKLPSSNIKSFDRNKRLSKDSLDSTNTQNSPKLPLSNKSNLTSTPKSHQKSNQKREHTDEPHTTFKRIKLHKQTSEDVLGLLANVAVIQERLGNESIEIDHSSNANANMLHSDIHNLSDIDSYIKENHQNSNVDNENHRPFNNLKERTLSNNSGDALLSDFTVLDGLNLSCPDSLLNISELEETNVSKETSLVNEEMESVPDISTFNSSENKCVDALGEPALALKPSNDVVLLKEKQSDVNMERDSLSGPSNDRIVSNSQKVLVPIDSGDAHLILPSNKESIIVNIHNGEPFNTAECDNTNIEQNADVYIKSTPNPKLKSSKRPQLKALDKENQRQKSLKLNSSPSCRNLEATSMENDKQLLNEQDSVEVDDFAPLMTSTQASDSSQPCDGLAESYLAENPKTIIVTNVKSKDSSDSMNNTLSDNSIKMESLSFRSGSSQNMTHSDSFPDISVNISKSSLDIIEHIHDDIIVLPLSGMGEETSSGPIDNGVLDYNAINFADSSENIPFCNNVRLVDTAVNNIVVLPFQTSPSSSICDKPISHINNSVKNILPVASSFDKHEVELEKMHFILTDEVVPAKSEISFDASGSMELPCKEDPSSSLDKSSEVSVSSPNQELHDSVLPGSLIINAAPSADDPSVTVYSILMKTVEDGNTTLKQIDLPPEELEIVINNMVPLNEIRKRDPEKIEIGA